MNRYSYIFQYVERLSRELECQIMIKDFVGFTARDPGVAGGMSPYCIHKSPYCLFLKNHAALWTRCHEASDQLRRHCEGQEGCFCGMCYAGFSETVLPIHWNGKLIAAICAGGYELNREKSLRRLLRTCEKYHLDYEESLAHYDRSITMPVPKPEPLEEVCGVLADFFRMYYTALVNAGYVNPNLNQAADAERLTALTSALEYIHMNFNQDIRLRDIAAFCGCSESYISHIFKKNMNCNISRFANRVRIEHAQRMIAEEHLPMHEIAGRCGFSDPNYFSTVFYSQTGMSPSQYKKSLALQNAEMPRTSPEKK